MLSQNPILVNVGNDCYVALTGLNGPKSGIIDDEIELNRLIKLTCRMVNKDRIKVSLMSGCECILQSRIVSACYELSFRKANVTRHFY